MFRKFEALGACEAATVFQPLLPAADDEAVPRGFGGLGFGGLGFGFGAEE